jgi:hypothetical protein
MEGVLPREVQWRTTKANLSPNFYRQLRTVDLVDRKVGGGGALASYVRRDRLTDVLRTYQGAPLEQRRLDGLAIFRAAVLEAWLERGVPRGRCERSDTRALSPVAA